MESCTWSLSYQTSRNRKEEQKCEARPAEYMSAKRTSTPEMLAKVIAFDAAQRSRSRDPGGFEMSSAGGCWFSFVLVLVLVLGRELREPVLVKVTSSSNDA